MSLLAGLALALLLDCEGPSFTYEPASVAPGGTITVTGRGFGDECYDTYPPGPPEGEGFLGLPGQDLLVVIVQGDREVLVAEGDAGAGYGFRVDVVVPPDLQPGPATVEVRRPDGASGYDGYDVTFTGLTITGDSPVDAATGEPTVADFHRPGPPPTRSLEVRAERGDLDAITALNAQGDHDGIGSRWWVLALAPAAVAARLVMVRRRWP